MEVGSVLVFSLAFLWGSSFASNTERCFSKEHANLIVNASAAFLARTTVLDAHTSLSQQACLLDCCSQKGFKCNWAVYKPDKPSGSENCYLFHCEREDDCPLIPMNGVNTYNIFTGVDYPSMSHLTTTNALAQLTTTSRATSSKTVQPTYVTTQPKPAATAHTLTGTVDPVPTQPVTTTAQSTIATQAMIITTQPPLTTPPVTTSTTKQPSTITQTTTQPLTTAAAQLTTTITTTQATTTTTTTTVAPQLTSATPTNSLLTTTIPNSQPSTTTTSTTRQPITTTTTTTESATTVLITRPPTSVLLIDTTTSKTTTTTSPIKSITTHISMQKTDTAPSLITTEQAAHTAEMRIGIGSAGTAMAETRKYSTVATATTKAETQLFITTTTTKPKGNIKNHSKPTRKQAMKPAPYNTRLGIFSATTTLPFKHRIKLTTASAKHGTTPGPAGIPHKAATKKPKTNLRTSATSLQTTTSTTETPAKSVTQSAAATTITQRTTVKESKSALVAPPQLAPPTTEPLHTNPPRKNTAHQGALKSTLEVAAVVGLVVLALVVALLGRKALESFNRRQYTRLELNDLYYDV